MKNMRVLLYFLCSLTATLPTTILIGQTAFVKKLGASNRLEEARRIIRTPDGNYLVAGYVGGAGMDREGLVFKMSESGTVLWAKSYGGALREEFYDVAYAGGYYYCVGYTSTWENEPTSSSNSRADVFLVKLNLDGTLVWAKNMGSPNPGFGSTIGNEVGLRLIPSVEGGVIVVARINSGANTDQNNGLIRVGPDAKTHWAYQYDFQANSNANELTYGIWRDGGRNYITGGWINTFSSFYGAFMFKVNEKGDLIWDQYTECSPSTFSSQYFGYYNHENGKIYTTDFYNKSSSSIRESIVITNLSSTGEVPPSGAIPQVATFHYGASGSAGNNYRNNIFPVGDGFSEFVLAGYSLNTPSMGTTRNVIIIVIDTDLNYLWSKQTGFPNVNNQINDMITCDGKDRDLLGVGTVASHTGEKDILVTRISYDQSSEACASTDNINQTNIAATDSALVIDRINLNTTGCGSACWADSDTISGVNVSAVTLPDTTDCLTISITQELTLNNIQVMECDALDCPKNLAFDFAKTPKEVYFQMTDMAGNFIVERFFGDVNKLKLGYSFTAMGLKKDEYIWELEATYDSESGLERKTGTFKIE